MAVLLSATGGALAGDRYIDGSRPSFGTGIIDNPYNAVTSSSVFEVNGDRFFCKRGTVISVTGNIDLNNNSWQAYGDPAAPLPVLQFELANTNGYFVDSHTSGECSFSDLHLRVGDGNNSGARRSGAAIGSKGARLVVTGCVIEGWAAGIRFSGADSVFSGNVIRHCQNGIYGGHNKAGLTDFKKPRNAWITDNTILADIDGITLHDGAYDPNGYWGYGNRILRNFIRAGTENAIDVLRGFPGTVIEDNDLGSPTLAVLGLSAYSDDASIQRNRFVESGTGRTAMLIRSSHNIIARNFIEPRASTSDATFIMVVPDTGAAETGSNVNAPYPYPAEVMGIRIIHNTFVMNSASQRSGVLLKASTSGELLNNIIVNESATRRSVEIDSLAFTNWFVDGNRHFAPANAAPFLVNGSNVSWSGWQAIKDANGTYGDPLLTNHVAGDALLALAGVVLAPEVRLPGYRSRTVPSGLQSVGCYEAPLLPLPEVPQSRATIRRADADGYWICWTSVPNATYRVEYSTNLNSNAWSVLREYVVSSGGNTCIYDRSMPSEARKFYRARVTSY